MRIPRILQLLSIAGLSLITTVAQAANGDSFLEQIHPPTEQAVGQGSTAIWTLPQVATQYQPSQPTAEMQAALQAQHEGRYLDALILLDEADKKSQANTNTRAELNLLRASFLLQGNQSQQALKTLTPLLASPQHAADAYALSAMAYIQQSDMAAALEAARHAEDSAAQGSENQLLPSLALSYAFQGAGRLTEARAVMHDFNAHAPPSAVALAREAEIALTLDQLQSARLLLDRANEIDPAHPYVTAVNGLRYLIDGQAQKAKAAFESALSHNPEDAKALFGLGLAEIKLGNFQAGQKDLQAAHEADPGNALILTYLGRSQQNLGQTREAMTSWRSAQLADPKDPIPWLYQAQAELRANRPQDARESLRQAQARLANRSVYRGEALLKEDALLLQANLAEAQRQLGLESLAFYTLTDAVGKKSSILLRNQADLLQGQRFGESARRSLLLQSQFDEKPGTLPPELDIYGDGAGQSGAALPQHGVVSELNAQQSSYNNYDELFSQRTTLAANATAGSQNSRGEQIRLGSGSDTLGWGLAQRQYQTDGFGTFNNLDNHVWQGIVQWRPLDTMQLFVSRQSFNSERGEMLYPADPLWLGLNNRIEDDSVVTRLGLRYSLSDNGELRGLISRQRTDQVVNSGWATDFFPPSSPYYTPPQLGVGNSYNVYNDRSQAQSTELQYRHNGTGYAAQFGVSSVRSPLFNPYSLSPPTLTNIAQQIYADWQQELNSYWQLEAGLAWGRNDRELGTSSTHMRRWLPRLGVVYTPDSATHVRIAAWKGMDDAAVGNASLAPATLAGIVLNHADDTYKLVRSIALGADRQLDAAWLLEGQAQRRWTDDPYASGGAQGYNQNQIDDSRLALHWQPANYPLNATLAYDDEHYWNDPANFSPTSVQGQHLRSQQLGLRWLATAQWTANLAWSHNFVTGIQQLGYDAFGNLFIPGLQDIQDRFNQTDASLNWQFNRMGSLDLGVRNATNKRFQYTEIDPLNPRFSKGRLSYVKLKLLW